ncbi:MAG: DUF4242 domain-containing protein [Dehalococcoidia bacterium]
MPLFLIERNFAEQIEITQEFVDYAMPIEAEIGITWLFSFLSVDKKKTYCVYEAPNAECIREAARRLKEPADVIIEVGQVLPGLLEPETLQKAFPDRLAEYP